MLHALCGGLLLLHDAEVGDHRAHHLREPQSKHTKDDDHQGGGSKHGSAIKSNQVHSSARKRTAKRKMKKMSPPDARKRVVSSPSAMAVMVGSVVASSVPGANIAGLVVRSAGDAGLSESPTWKACAAAEKSEIAAICG